MAMLAACAPGVRAQDSIPWPAGNNLTVTLRPESLSVRGDSIRIWYALSNAATSQQSARHLAVRTSVAHYAMGSPSRWYGSPGIVQDSAAALWTALLSRPDVQPGETKTGFWLEAHGLPAIVPFRVQGRYDVPVYNDSLPWLIKEAPSFWVNSVGGLTLGIEPFPTDLSTGSLLSRIRDLTDRACSELAWITSPSVCTSLTTKLQQASQAALQGDSLGARAPLQSFTTELQSQHNSAGTLPVTDNAYWLLKVNAEFILGRLPPASGTAHTLYLRGSGGTANPPTLSLTTAAPTATTAKYKDSPSIKFSGGNAWAAVGTWTAALGVSTPPPLGDVQAWLGLKNSDDIGTNFDVRVEVLKNGTLVAAGQARCVSGISNPPANAKSVLVAFSPSGPGSGNGPSDVLALKVLTRIGTTSTGTACGGHSNATGLRLYFDATSRPARAHWQVTQGEQ